MESYEETSPRERFARPSNEFRMMPFWFWNHEMVEKEVCRQIADHHAHGIGGEFLHPRHGRLTPYMGRRWLEVVEAAADKCKELDMPCFLYDEDNWPSGPAGGYITGPYNLANRAKFLAIFDEDEWQGPTHVTYELDYPQIGEEVEFFYALALPAPENYPSLADGIAEVRDVSAHVTGTTFAWDVPEGRWMVVFFCQVPAHYADNMNGYIDVLRPETVQEFIEFTHAKYADWFVNRGKADYLGTVVPGIFTDEPSMAHASSLLVMFKWVTWTPRFPEHFQAMHGYPVVEALLSLFHDTGAVSAKHRCDYWTCVTDLYVKAFYLQIEEFCDRHGWRHTGHVNAEGTLPSQIRNQGDLLRVLQHLHYGGCDQLTEDVRPDYHEHLWDLADASYHQIYHGMANEMVVTSKFASSAAHLYGKPRVLVEAFGTSSWDITLASCKRVSDFLVATGCDLFVPHDFAYSEDGYRKLDHPASFNYQPYYAHWKRLADHNARLCAILNAHSGVLQAPVLFLYPTYGFYAEMQPHDGPMATTMAQYFNHTADCLMRQQVDFEFANEALVLGAEVEGATLRIREQAFPVFLLGATTCISMDLARALQTFVRAGGKVVATHVLPVKAVDEGTSTELAGIMREVFGVEAMAVYQRVTATETTPVPDPGSSPTSAVVHEQVHPNGGRAFFIETPPGVPFAVDYFPQLQKVLTEALPLAERPCAVFKTAAASVERHAAYISACVKRIGADTFVFLANTSREADYRGARATLAAPAGAPGVVELWDTETGVVHEIRDVSRADGRVELTLDFPPYQSYLLRLGAEPTPAANPPTGSPASASPEELIAPPSPTEAPVRSNPIAALARPESSPVETLVLGGEWTYDLARTPGLNCVLLHEGWESRYDVTAGKAWGYAAERTFTIRFVVEDLDALGPVKLVIEGLVGDYGWAKTTTDPLRGGDRAHFTMPACLKFSLNGRAFTPRFDFTPEFLDPCWVLHDITALLQAGENELTMVCSTRNHQTFHVVTDPWRLVGEFEALVVDGVVHLRAPGGTVMLEDLCAQGLAGFHGGFPYEKRVAVPGTFAGKRVTLAIHDTTDAVEVWVNDVLVGVAWHAWEVDVTAHVRPGEANTFRLVHYGIAQNIMQTNQKPHGLRGRVELAAYEPRKGGASP